MIAACNEADDAVPEADRAGEGEQSRDEWNSTWLRCPLEGLRDEVWNKTPNDPMLKADLLKVLDENDMVDGSDYEFIKAESHKVQDGVEPAPDGMISYAEWSAIWAKTDLYALRDKIWDEVRTGDIMKEEDLATFLRTGNC